MGLNTGIDLELLLEVRRSLAGWLPNEQTYGFTSEAGLPLGFAPAAA